MLVSGGQILAIDRVYTDKNTISGDGVKHLLGVNTDVIATTALVSNTSATLQTEIDDISGKFDDYYTKDQTSAADQISAALEGVIRHETEVSGDDVTIVTKKVVKPDGTVVYQVSATPQADIVIHGTDGISAAATQDGWTISYTGQQGNIYSGYPGTVDIFQSAGQWYISANVPDVSNFLTSATGHEDEALVLKNNQWVLADDIFATDEDISKLSATVASTYLSASEFKTYSANVDNRLTALESTAEHYTTNSANYYSTYQTVYNNSAAWNAHSALSATKLDASESAKFMKIADLQSAPENTISGYGESAFYYPPFPEIPEYTGNNGIEVTEEHVIKLSAEFLSASDKYLSANALDDLSGKWEDTANTVSTASAGWNEASAFGANSGKFVTSAGFEFEDDLAYFIKKTENSTTWSGVDLSDLGKIFPISSLTQDLISATVSSVDGTPTYVLSAAKPEEVAVPGISGEGLSASYDADNNRYNVQINISGHNGISAEYDDANNAWNVGISVNDYSYLAGLYDKQAALTEGDIIKYDSSNTQHIEIDEDGYILLPNTGNKFTFCINESIENNTTSTHDYKLNKIALVKTNIQTNAEEVIVATHSYYPSEIGASDANISFTLSHLPFYKYAVKYLGSDIPVTANLVSKISIIEEITSLATTEGGGKTYGGVEPVWVDNDANLVGLAYDRTQFRTVTGVDEAHPELSALQIDIHTTGGNIDQEAFEKIANLIYGRLTETIPIGLVNSYETLADGGSFSYLFRPIMEFDVHSGTKARIMTHNGTVGNSKAQIVISELNETDASISAMWWSEIKTLTAEAGTLTLTANPDCTIPKTLYPDRLYYATIINRDQQTQYVGFENKFLTDAGAYDIAYYNQHSTGTGDFAYSLPWSMNGLPANQLGQVGEAKLKPYIAFRNEV